MRTPPYPRRIGTGDAPLEGRERLADRENVGVRLRSEEGFGLLELLMAMVMLNIGILAIVAAFNSGALALSRASRTSTASALGDSQMESFRGLDWDNIVQKTSEWSAATGDSTWTADNVYQQN